MAAILAIINLDFLKNYWFYTDTPMNAINDNSCIRCAQKRISVSIVIRESHNLLNENTLI